MGDFRNLFNINRRNINKININKLFIFFSLGVCISINTSDVPDSLSGSGSGQILPILSDIPIWPDPNLKKLSGSGSGRILI